MAYNYNLGFELDKRITENFGFAINGGYTWLTQPGSKTANGWNNIVVTLKYKPYVNAEHEFILSLGVQRNSPARAPTGQTARPWATTTAVPLGRRCISARALAIYRSARFRPLMLTGELTYSIADKGLKVNSLGNPLNNGNPNTWSGGLSLQYSIRYLSSQVKDYGLPSFVNKLTPVVELAWSSSASQPNDGTPTTYLWVLG